MNEAVGTTGNILVYVDDMDQLFVDQALVGLAEEGTSLLLTAPFSRTE